jgi:hypothetical protein
VVAGGELPSGLEIVSDLFIGNLQAIFFLFRQWTATVSAFARHERREGEPFFETIDKGSKKE